MALYNKIDKRVLKEQLKESSEKRLTISFYQYHHLQNPEAFRDKLYERWEKTGVFGRTYLATEGVNAQISVPTANFEAFKTDLYSIDWLNGVRLNIAVEDDGKSFYKLKIKVRDKVLADGLSDKTFDVTDKGQHVGVEGFNQLANDPNTVIIDMRNHYETEVGHFEGAITPDVDTFRDSLPVIENMIEAYKEDKNLLMYCTGGIRCEKASAYFRHKGFKKVFQLEGGIIKYAQDAKDQNLENKFIGKNFVFDERLGERITDDVISNCHQCGKSCDTHTNCVNDACHLLFIQCEECVAKYNACCSDECKDFVALPEEEQKEQRKGIELGTNIFKKGRFGKMAGRFKDKLKSKEE